MLVFDTSAFLNGWKDHLSPKTFPSVWALISHALADGRIVGPREVLTELVAKDDDVGAWAKQRGNAFVEATEAIQLRAGEIYGFFPNPGVRDQADPFVIAEAEKRGFTVVTYEGRSFNGVPHKNWSKTMPGICRHFNVPCATLPEALAMLGGTF